MEYFDRDGESISYMKWIRIWLEIHKKSSPPSYIASRKIIQQNGWIRIEAMWIGKAESFGPNGPLVFQTRVSLIKEGNNTTSETYQYATEEETLKHFETLCEFWDNSDQGSLSRFTQVAEDL